MPEWQGAGVGTRFLEWVCQYHLEGNGRGNKKYGVYFHTSHPQLCAYLRSSPQWEQKSASLYGGNKTRSFTTIQESAANAGIKAIAAGYGGHFRAVQGFKYTGGKA